MGYRISKVLLLLNTDRLIDDEYHLLGQIVIIRN